MTPTDGRRAPDFELRDQHGRRVSLSSLRGERHVLLVFFPFAFSGVCTGELHALRENLTALEDRGAAVVGLSCDPMYALRVFGDRDGLDFPLLSDFWPHGAVASAYGVLDEERGCPTRSTFLVDREGVVRWSVHQERSVARDVREYFEVLQRLDRREAK